MTTFDDSLNLYKPGKFIKAHAPKSFGRPRRIIPLKMAREKKIERVVYILPFSLCVQVFFGRDLVGLRERAEHQREWSPQTPSATWVPHYRILSALSSSSI